MVCVITNNISADIVNVPQKRAVSVTSIYNVDFCYEVRKRWMVLGVLVSVSLAVLSPRSGAPGGVLHTQYLSYLPLSYIYYSAGLRTRVGALYACVRDRPRLHALCCAHAHIIAPALCAIVVTAFRDGVDYRIVKGAMLSSVCGGCPWLSLALCGGAAVTATAFSCAMSVLVAPLLCGLNSIPSVMSLLSTLLSTLAPFAVGLYRPVQRCDQTATKLSALSLVYVDCCERLCDAAGILYVGDVMATLLLVLCWLSAVAAASAVYARSGMLSCQDAHVVLMCALPKSTHNWECSATCSLTGLARLPAAFLSPAQALFLAALAGDDLGDDGGDDKQTQLR